MSRLILASLVALLGLTTGAAFATNDFLAREAASQAAFINGSSQLAFGSEGGAGGNYGGGSTKTNDNNGSAPGGQSTKGSEGGRESSTPGGGGTKTGGGTGDPDKTGSGPGSTRGGDKDPGARSPGTGGNGTPDRQTQNQQQGRGGTPPQGKDPAMGGGGGCNGGGGCDQGGQQATKDKEAAAQKSAERTQNYAKDLQNYNRDRQSSPAEIKAAKEAAEARLSQTPKAPTPTYTGPAMAKYGISPQQGVNRYTTLMSNRVSRFQTPAQYDANTTVAQRQATVEGLQDFSNREQAREAAGLAEGAAKQAERDAQALTDSWNDYSDLRGYMEREMAQVRAEQEAEQREISDDDLRETAVNAGFPTSVGDAEAVAERLAGYVDVPNPPKEITDRVPSVDPTTMARNYAAYNNPNAVNPDGTPAKPASPGTLKGSPETVSSISDPDVPTRESIREGLKLAGAFGPETPEEGPGSISEMVNDAYRDAMSEYSAPEVNRAPPDAVFSGRGTVDPTAAAREYSAAIAKAEATRKAFNDPTRASLTPSEQRMRDMASYGEAQDTMRMNAELDRRDQEATARESAEASRVAEASRRQAESDARIASERSTAQAAADKASQVAEASRRQAESNARAMDARIAQTTASEASRVAEASRRQAESDARIASEKAAAQMTANKASQAAEAARRQTASDDRIASENAAKMAETNAQEAANEASRVAEASRRQAESDARLAEQRAVTQAAANEASRMAEASRRQAESDARLAQARADQRKADLANYGQAQDTMRVNAELDRRDREATAADASRVAEASRRQAESDARLAEQRASEVVAIDAKAAANEASRIAEAARRQAESDTRLASERAAEVARIDAEVAAANRSIVNTIKGLLGLGPAVSDVDPKIANAQRMEARVAAQAAADEASRVAEASRRQAESDARIASEKAAAKTAAEQRAVAIAQDLAGFGNAEYKNNLGTAPNQSVKTADSGLVETAPGKGDMETEQSLAQKIGGWVKDVFTSAEPMPKPDQVVQKTTIAVKGTVTVNGVKVEVKAERNIETGELSTPIGGVAGDNTLVSAPDGIRTVKTEKGTEVDVAVKDGKIVGISGVERPATSVNTGRGTTDPTAAAKEYSDSLAREAARKADLANYGQAQADMRTQQAKAAADKTAADEASRVAEASRRQTESDARIATERAAEVARIDREVAVVNASLYKDYVAPVVGAVTRPFKALSSWWNEKPATPPVAEVPQHGTPEERLQQEINAALGDTEITTPKAIKDRVPAGKQIDDRLEGGELTDNVGPTGVITQGNKLISKGAVVTMTDLNNPPSQTKTRSVQPAADTPYDQQAINDRLYDGLPEAVVPGAKVQPKPATPEVKTVEPKKDVENEVVVDVEEVPEAEKPAPKPAEKKKGVLDTIRGLLPGGEPSKPKTRDEGGGSDNGRPWWVKEQNRKEPVATTTAEYDRGWIQTLRARLGW